MAPINSQQILERVADVRTGYTFRGKIELVSPKEGTAHIAQITDARKIWEETNSDMLRADQLPMIQWDGKDKAFIKPGLVLLPARGVYFRASCYLSAGESHLPVIVSSQFLIIEPKRGLKPEFLCWYLNQPSMQRILADASQGTSIPLLRAATVKQLKLEVPSLDKQEQILHINQMWEQEQQLTQALLKNRETMLQGVFQQLLKEKSS